MIDTFIYGLLTCLSLIVAIGAQNAFVLRIGLENRPMVTFLVCLFCTLCDIALIGLGVFGAGAFFTQHPWLEKAITFLGVIFIFGYALVCFYRLFKSRRFLKADEQQTTKPQTHIKVVIFTAMAVTLLNPHVYVDAFVLIGAIATHLKPGESLGFWFGGITASTLWFFTLGYLAQKLAPVFKKPITWQVLDGVIGGVMLWIGFSLLQFLIQI